MRSGRETLVSIEEALKDINGQENRLQRELEQANRERAELAAKRIESLRALAAVRARDALSDGVVNDADNLSAEVRTILQARVKTIAQLDQRRKQADTARETLIRRLDELNSKIAALEERLDRFGDKARASLKDDSEYKSLVHDYGHLAGMLEKANAKAEQASKDEHEKGEPYRSDPLFMYLWKRRFGTAAYESTGIVRMLDEWVAGLVRYSDARANYAMLTEIPVRLRAHADDLAKRTAEARAKLEAVETGKTRELAGSDITLELRTARDEQSGLNKDLASITAELTETGNQLKLYAKGEDQSFQNAVKNYADFLDQEPLQRLMADAFATKTPEDDRIVQDAQRLGRDLDIIKSRNEELRVQLDQLFNKKQELARLSANFRRERYDDTGSEFSDNPNLQELLQLLLRGAISAAEYWARVQSQQRWRRRPGDPWRRRSGLPPFEPWPGGWPGGGRWDGGGREPSERSDSSSGADFETGGSI